MSPATVATRPMHAPACETMPALAEYYGRGGANKTTNKYSSFPSRTPSSSLPLPSTVVRYTTRPSSSSAPPLSLAAAAAYPMYPGLQTAAAATPNSSSSMSSTTNTAGTAPISSLARRRGQNPSPLNRPRKISNTNNARDGGPSATTGLRHLPCRPRQQQQEPNELFRTLPAEVLAGVLAQLRWLHLGPGATSCATCLARDLCSLSLASRAWCAAAQPALYRCVCLVGAGAEQQQQQRKRFRRGGGSSSSGGVCIRMTLLRRTLRANDRLAAMVRELQVPAPPGDAPTTTTPIGLARNNDHENAVAALVMACPNLEVLAGPLAATYTHHEFSRVTHALATRTQLRTINWRIGASDDPRIGSDPGGSSCFARGGGGVFSSALTAPQETRFLEYHRGWPCLASLSIHCLPGASLATLLPRALTCLPALQHLHLCALPSSAFSDATLLALPALQSLTLSHMPGVSAAGLSALATRPNSRALRRLQLRHTALTSLPALARLLSHLPALEVFALVQHVAPLMPRDEGGGGGGAFALWMMPYLASRTLVRLHWDVVAAGAGGVSDADDILARSIAAGGFPALRTLRAPNDPEGIFQQLCRPLESIATSADRIWANGGRSGSSHGQQQRRSGSVDSGGLLPASRFGGLPKSATATSLPTGSSSSLTGGPPPHATDLRGARIAAQARLEDARPRFRFRVQVHSDEGGMVEEFGLGGYMGTVDSPVRYCLEPDPGSSDARGGLVDVPDLAAAPPEEEDDDGVAALGCTGSWNWREGVVVADRKEKESWWHAERSRWVRPRLDNGEDIRHAARTAMTDKEKNTIPELRIPMV